MVCSLPPDNDNHDDDERQHTRFPPPSIHRCPTPTAAVIRCDLRAFCFPPAVKLVVELFVPDVPPPPDTPNQCSTHPHTPPPRRCHIANISHRRATALPLRPFCAVGGSRSPMTPPTVHRLPSNGCHQNADCPPLRPVRVLLQFQRGNTWNPVYIVVYNDNDAEDNGIILSGVSVICCHRRCRCRPPSVVGCCVAHFAVCPYCQPLPATALLILSRLYITFDAPIDGWLLLSPPTKQHTN